MAALSGFALAALLALPDPSGIGGVSRWSVEIQAAATRCGVPGEWIARVMQAESAGKTTIDGRPIRSVKGAIGLMQLMPATWAELRRDLDLGDDPDLPADNIVAGACYLRRMYDRFGYPGLFAAYNAGPARYAAWLGGEARLPAETMAYLRSVSGDVPAPTEASSPPAHTLFLVRRVAPSPTREASYSNPVLAIFVLRREVP
ncbi:lytic transglycosylase domain-containing protein [Sphingomonas qomolangmaensis]|uniref:Lytic transglycosylase domain-containing protein n=1 Tax=Sphingomonas qomolangmaensis TaxID=2918765 RepID=A0ABY5L9T4_9SPHN|nr:lytic transglycosylase domain-containing protein [Sphingomonas qomolangmaensis]UUL82564.1 lytic transglycosylase domain-containing protein [Sphingomonas qomolangmaensis]